MTTPLTANLQSQDTINTKKKKKNPAGYKETEKPQIKQQIDLKLDIQLNTKNYCPPLKKDKLSKEEKLRSLYEALKINLFLCMMIQWHKDIN